MLAIRKHGVNCCIVVRSFVGLLEWLIIHLGTILMSVIGGLLPRGRSPPLLVFPSKPDPDSSSRLNGTNVSGPNPPETGDPRAPAHVYLFTM